MEFWFNLFHITYYNCHRGFKFFVGFIRVAFIQVKRVLKSRGKFICLTLAESHVLGTLTLIQKENFCLYWRDINKGCLVVEMDINHSFTCLIIIFFFVIFVLHFFNQLLALLRYMLLFIILGLLFPKFRFGWNVCLYAIPQKPSTKTDLQTFMVVAEKESYNELHQIISSFDHFSLACNPNQVFRV